MLVYTLGTRLGGSPTAPATSRTGDGPPDPTESSSRERYRFRLLMVATRFTIRAMPRPTSARYRRAAELMNYGPSSAV